MEYPKLPDDVFQEDDVEYFLSETEEYYKHNPNDRYDLVWYIIPKSVQYKSYKILNALEYLVKSTEGSFMNYVCQGIVQHAISNEDVLLFKKYFPYVHQSCHIYSELRYFLLSIYVKESDKKDIINFVSHFPNSNQEVNMAISDYRVFIEE
jgi:hypothetical protein